MKHLNKVLTAIAEATDIIESTDNDTYLYLQYSSVTAQVQAESRGPFTYTAKFMGNSAFTNKEAKTIYKALRTRHNDFKKVRKIVEQFADRKALLELLK